MAKSPRMSNLTCIAALQAIVDDLNLGTPYIEIRTGAPPATLEDAATGTLLATCQMSSPPFLAAVDANPGAMSDADTISDDPSAAATGIAGWFRTYTGTAVAKFQGTVGTSDADMIVNTTNVVSGLPFGVASYVLKLPEAPGEAPGNG
jgi:hypothetical protein